MLDTAAAPNVLVNSLEFSDGQSFDISPTDIVVFVGPNNTGKTRALKDIEAQLAGKTQGQVVVDVGSTRSDHSGDAVRDHVVEQSRLRNRPYRSPIAQGFGYSIQHDAIASRWESELRDLTGFFVQRIDTETRLTDSNPAPSIAIRSEPPTHPIHLLYADDSLELQLSNHFFNAFDADLMVDRLGGNRIPLRVGERLSLLSGEHYHSASYDQRFQRTSFPLEEQGDGMRSFATVILRLFAIRNASIALLDEPEAFLHPPQASLLGQLIAADSNTDRQYFIATHSPHVLEGLLTAPDSNRLRIFRIDRRGDSNIPHELDKTIAKEIDTDPLLKHSSVLSGVFHRRTVVCEAETDCVFYRAILEEREARGDVQPDVLFLSANGKHRVHKLASAMKAMGVPVDAIVDLDVLNDSNIVQRMFESLGGDWDDVREDYSIVSKAIESRFPQISASQMKDKTRPLLESDALMVTDADELFKKIKREFDDVSAWTNVKKAGEAQIPSGDPTVAYRRLKQKCQSVGLWLVPEGEIEGFDRNVGGHGTSWLQKVLANNNAASGPELKSARDFVRRIWNSR